MSSVLIGYFYVIISNIMKHNLENIIKHRCLLFAQNLYRDISGPLKNATDCQDRQFTGAQERW